MSYLMGEYAWYGGPLLNPCRFRYGRMKNYIGQRNIVDWRLLTVSVGGGNHNNNKEMIGMVSYIHFENS